MPAYTLKIRRYDPQSGEAAHWEEHTVEMPETQSVLDAILQIRDEVDGSIGIRCSCQQAICGSCGVRMNGKPGLACNTHLDEAAERRFGARWIPPEEGRRQSVIDVEPMGNMPVIRDLIVDMDAVHWKKVQRVTPWLINREPVPERDDGQWLKHIDISAGGADVPLVSYSPVTITRWQPEERTY